MPSPKIFLSYSRIDAAFALDLAVKLRKAGADLWIDQMDIPAGARWDVEVGNALEKAECVLVIISKTSVSSNNVLDEVSYALECNKRVVPILIDECTLPFRLKRLQYIDFTQHPDTAFEKLLQSLQAENTASPVLDAAQAAAIHPGEVPLQSASNGAAAGSPLSGRPEAVRIPGRTSSFYWKAGIIASGAAAVIAIAVFLNRAELSGNKVLSGKPDTLTATPTSTDTGYATEKQGGKARGNIIPGKNNLPGHEPAKQKSGVTVKENASPEKPATNTEEPAANPGSAGRTLSIASGEFRFIPGSAVRTRGEFTISLWHEGKKIWFKQVPASSVILNETINVAVNPRRPVSLKIQYCSPKAMGQGWTGGIRSVLTSSNNKTIVFEGRFDLRPADGQCTAELLVERTKNRKD